MEQRNYQQGSAHVVAIICLVLALLTALSWVFYQNFIHKDQPQKTTDLVIVDKKATDNLKSSNPTATQDENSASSSPILLSEWGMKLIPSSTLESMNPKIETIVNNGVQDGSDKTYYSLTTSQVSCTSKGSVSIHRSTGGGGLTDPVVKVGQWYYFVDAAPPQDCPQGKSPVFDAFYQEIKTSVAKIQAIN